MIAEVYEKGTLVPRKTLWEALKTEEKHRIIISFVGAGGKTSLMYQLAKELAAMGKQVIVTTSTHIRKPSNLPVCVIREASEVKTKINKNNWNQGILVVGRDCGSKLSGLPPSQISELGNYADVLLIEADGAKGLPLKVPAGHEPVLIPETDLVIASAGLDSIGSALQKSCFRWEIAVERLQAEPDHLLTEKDMAIILTESWGAKKAIGNAAYRIVLNKADSTERKKQAIEVLRQIQGRQAEICLVTSFCSCREKMEDS